VNVQERAMTELDIGSDDAVESVLLASRALVGVAARSVATVEDDVALPRFRVLVVLASHGPSPLHSIAAALSVHPSSATRACDRLVADGLIDRREEPTDRRLVRLTITRRGQRVVDTVITRRRAALAEILGRMSAADRGALVPALLSFAAAAGESDDGDAWSIGWPTNR
jgi:DNA-binding MarR family transcriptional regulator